MNRNGNNPATLQMDALTYGYKSENTGGSTVRRSSNMLLSYNDIQAYASRYSDDVDGYGLAFDAADPGTWNYKYDEIGNLVQDNSEQIANIEWDVYGKIKKITRSSGSNKSDLEFIYDPMGIRIAKIEKPRENGSLKNENDWKYTWYTLDAQGQALATHSMVYETVIANSRYRAKYLTEEEYIYGSSRLGTMTVDAVNTPKTREFTISGFTNGLFSGISWITGTGTSTPCSQYCYYEYSHIAGLRQYELTNHLGNVMVTVNDRKVYDGSNFVARVMSAQTYYPGGSIEAGRMMNSSAYRFGQNTQEADMEISGIWGTHYTAEFWEYDARLMRRWNRDPVIKPWESLYLCFSGNPLFFNDLKGNSATPPDRWKVDAVTKEVTWISNEGGSDIQYIDIYLKGEFKTFKIYSSRFNVNIKSDQEVNFEWDYGESDKEFKYKAGAENLFSENSQNYKDQHSSVKTQQDGVKQQTAGVKQSIEDKKDMNGYPVTWNDVVSIYTDLHPGKITSMIGDFMLVLSFADIVNNMHSGDWGAASVGIVEFIFSEAALYAKFANYLYSQKAVQEQIKIDLWDDYKLYQNSDPQRAEKIARTIKSM